MEGKYGSLLYTTAQFCCTQTVKQVAPLEEELKELMESYQNRMAKIIAMLSPSESKYFVVCCITCMSIQFQIKDDELAVVIADEENK